MIFENIMNYFLGTQLRPKNHQEGSDSNTKEGTFPVKK